MILPCAMADPSFFDRMISQLRTTCKYYTGYPKDLGPSQVIHFTSEREFIRLLHEGYPVAVAFTIKGNYTKHLDKVLEEAAAEFYPHVKFMRVECPKYPGFCITRQRKDYPFIEIYHNPIQAANQGRMADPNVIKYNVAVLPGYIVLNRSWAFVQWLEKATIEEERVYFGFPYFYTSSKNKA